MRKIYKWNSPSKDITLFKYIVSVAKKKQKPPPKTKDIVPALVHTIYKNDSKWTTKLNITAKIIKVLEEDRKKSSQLGSRQNLLMRQKEIPQKNWLKNKLDFNLKYISDKRLLSRIYEFLKSIIKETTQFFKWVGYLNWQFPKQDNQKSNKQLSVQHL